MKETKCKISKNKQDNQETIHCYVLLAMASMLIVMGIAIMIKGISWGDIKESLFVGFICIFGALNMFMCVISELVVKRK